MPPVCCSRAAEPSAEPALAYYWRTKSPESSRFFCTSPTFYLQIPGEIRVGDALSNQRPLPWEGSALLSWMFAVVQKYLQISIFLLRSCRPCSPLFVWVGVLTGVVAAKLTLWRSHRLGAR
jgi:hypothetical protein